VIVKAIEQLEKADIEALISQEVSEGRTIEYKEALPGSADSDRKEFLADVASFANAAGGHLIYGMRERRVAEKTSGVAEAALGLARINLDQEVPRLQDMIRTGIEPTIVGVQVREFPGFPEGPIIVLQIPKSWAAPHMVTYKGHDRFYTRDARGKHPLDVHEIRAAFALSESLPERIRRFRADRIPQIVAGETPLPVPRSPKIVLHLLPIAALDPSTRLDVAPLATGSALKPCSQASLHERLGCSTQL